MNKDIRIATSFLTHRKRKKLQKALGADGVVAFIDLLLSTAIYRPDGVLTGLDEEDIALDAQWAGDEKEFVETLLRVGFLEKTDDGGYSIHDWVDHNGYASSADERSEKARLNRMAKTHPKLFKELKKEGRKGISAEEYKELTTEKQTVNDSLTDVKYKEQTVNESLTNTNDEKQTVNAPLTPSPSPSPSPSKKKTPETARGNFSDFDKKKVKSLDARSDEGKNHFVNVNKACERISRLPPKRKKFNPYQWAQSQVKKACHPGAIAESLDGLAMLWDSAESPWSYADTILKTKNGNWNEADAIKISQEMKSLEPQQLQAFTCGLFQPHVGKRRGAR